MPRLTIESCELLPEATSAIRGMKKLPGRVDGTKDNAILVAARHAKKSNVPMFVYPGNSYMHAVWLATYRERDALDPVNNTGAVVFRVDPDLSLHRCKIRR